MSKTCMLPASGSSFTTTCCLRASSDTCAVHLFLVARYVCNNMLVGKQRLGSATESYAACGVMNDGWAFLDVLKRLPFASLASTSPVLFTLRIPMFGQM